MQNLLIVDNDISYIQNILSSISESITNLKLYNFYICETPKIFNELKNHAIDIIVFNINTMKTNLLKFIYQNSIEFYQKSIIILYENKKELKNIINEDFEKYVFKYIKKSDKLNLINSLRTLNYIKENNHDEIILKIKIEKNLKKIGFNLNHNGTKYLVEAIQYLHLNNIENIKLNNIYHYLSQKHNKSENTIKGNIRKATEYMYKHYNQNAIVDFFNYLELVDLPTPSEIIFTTLEKI